MLSSPFERARPRAASYPNGARRRSSRSMARVFGEGCLAGRPLRLVKQRPFRAYQTIFRRARNVSRSPRLKGGVPITKGKLK
jgi:hypothetical protein